jgi:hypothetical protein
MDALLLHVISWPTLGCALLVYGFAPGALLRLIVLLYPRDHPRRRELIGELYGVPRIKRPFWVAEQLETALFEGLHCRLAAGRARRMVPAVIHVRLSKGWWTLELRVTAELKRSAGLPVEQFIEAFDRAVLNGMVRRVRMVPGVQPVTPLFKVEFVRPGPAALRAGAGQLLIPPDPAIASPGEVSRHGRVRGPAPGRWR